MAVKINSVPGAGTPLVGYNWEVVITRAPSGVSFPENLKLRAVSSTIPERRFDRIEINYQQWVWVVPGREIADKEITLEFWEGTDMAVRNAFVAWLKAVGDWESGRQGTKEDVSGDIQLKLLDESGNVIKIITLRNAWPCELKDINSVRFEVTFWFDWFEES